MSDKSGSPVRLVYLSPVPLGSFSQRPHHFVRWFHDRFGAEVMWIDPYPTRLAKTSDIRRLWHRAPTGLGPEWEDESWIERVSVPAIPLEPLAVGRHINHRLWKGVLERVGSFVSAGSWIVVAKPCELGLELRRRFPQCAFVFDVLDNTPAFSEGLSRKWMEYAEHQVADRADWIITSSSPLHDKFAGIWPSKTRLARNGLSALTRDYPRADPGASPPVIGFVGAIASWFDWNAVIRLAKKNPDATIQLIGPCGGAPDRLPENVALLPAIPHIHVYDVMSTFSVGLIPFVRNSLTEYVDPVKFYEYRAMGLPVLSTKFGEMRYRDQDDGVFFLEEFGDLQSLLSRHAAEAGTEMQRSFQQENCWVTRFDQLDIFND